MVSESEFPVSIVLRVDTSSGDVSSWTLGILCIYEKQGAGGKRVDQVQIGHGFAYVFDVVCFGLS